ncbi:MAG TPA: 30S ribosomal protein S4e [Thermoplasmataceae archaeon]|nr:30S ribosomal protein S4e [Thermoplasmataceae archaeon]
MINKTKRLVVPRSVDIPRKTHFWGPTPSPGPHSKERSVTLLSVLRDYLHYGDKEREITRMLNSGFVKVDGKVVKERRRGVGFMDVIELAPLKKFYRVVYDRKGRLKVAQEKEELGKIKLLKVTDKITVEPGKFRLVFHDGQNVVSEGSEVSPGDVVVVQMPEKKFLNVLKLQQGNKVFLTGGTHVGSIATVQKVEVKESSGSNLIHLQEGFSTIAEYAFPISSAKFQYEIPEVIQDAQ